MNKKFKKFGCLALCAAFALPLVACDKTPQNGGTSSIYDPETRPLTLSLSTPDGNFNPFFATSQPDNDVIAHTQVAMMTIDGQGNSVCGDNYDTVALDNSITYYDKGNTAVPTPTPDGTSEYKFLLKNGIKYSDGTPLTIKDVLFNLYVYLDPAYSGSSTIYSTKIEGLRAYRTQDASADDSGSSSDRYMTLASSVIRDMQAYYSNPNRYSGATNIADIEKYGDIAKGLYRTALLSMYNGIDLSSYEKEYRFTEKWHAFFFEMGYIEKQFQKKPDLTNEYLKDEQGRFYTTLDDIQSGCELQKETVVTQYMQAALSSATDKANAMRDACVKYCYDADTNSSQTMAGVTAFVSSELSTRIAADLRKESNQTLAVSSISGVKASKTKEFKGKTYTEDHELLTVRVKGIDAKAIYNFSFAVAPMHYYGGSEAVSSFNYEGVDGYDATKPISAGVKWSDTNFFNDVLANETKNALPVGAGPYKAANSSFNDAATAGGKFYDNVTNYVYYVRNDNFHTLGAGINNAKIKNLQYRIATGDNILNLLKSKSIDYGSPDAKPTTVSDLAKDEYKDYLGTRLYDTGGYGYIGINPAKVESVYLRRAIMKAMNTSLAITQFYSDALASLITRPMSKTSWAYDHTATEYVSEDGTSYKFNAATAANDIKALMVKAGASKGDPRLKLTFTIAGETTEHPAYAIFQQAQNILKECGFDITVSNDVQALSKLARGELSVWAAAWSSSVDPDMYQVYHKDSKATSVKNWNYEAILNDPTDKWKFEKNIIYKLSDVIDKARESTNQAARKDEYKKALDYVMELAVELPTYQRKDLSVYNLSVIKVSSMNANPNNYRGLLDRLWDVEYN